MGLSPLVLHMNYAIIDVESTVTQSPYFASYQRLPADSMHAVQESGGRSYSSPISKRAHVRRAGSAPQLHTIQSCPLLRICVPLPRPKPSGPFLRVEESCGESKRLEPASPSHFRDMNPPMVVAGCALWHRSASTVFTTTS